MPLVSGKEHWAAVNELDSSCSTERLRKFHACVHQHDCRDLSCVQAHYANAVGNDVYSFDWEPKFASDNLIHGTPILSQAADKLERSKSAWFPVLEPAITKVLGARQAMLSQESSLEVVSIHLDTSTVDDSVKIERFFSEFKNSQTKTFRSLMMPCTVMKVPGVGPFAKDNLIPAKILLGDGIDTMIELVLPLEVDNEDRDNPVMRLATGSKMHASVSAVLTALPFYLVGDSVESSIIDAWKMLNQISNKAIKRPYTINLMDLFRYSGVWIKRDSSVQLMNWIFTGALTCEIHVVAKAAFHKMPYRKLPNVYRLYSRDKLISVRNCIQSFYILMLPQGFPDLEATMEMSKLDSRGVCQFIPSAYEQSFGIMTSNRLHKLFSLSSHFIREDLSSNRGILKQFDKIFYAYKLSLCNVVWDLPAYNKRFGTNDGQIPDPDDNLIDSDPEDDSHEIPDFDPKDYSSFREIMAAHPVMGKDQVVERWILADPQRAFNLMKRSKRDVKNPATDFFQFGCRARVKLFQATLESVLEIPNMTQRRPSRANSRKRKQKYTK